MSEPTTQAGRAFLGRELVDRFQSAIDDTFQWAGEETLLAAILAIEAEARADRDAEVAALRAALRGVHDLHGRIDPSNTTASTAGGACICGRALAQPVPEAKP